MNNDLQELKSVCQNCKKCELYKKRKNLVFGDGNPESKLMFVGEGPGENEDNTGIPFVGRAGKLLDTYLEAVGLSREDVYICNMVKCRPPENRDPLPEEQEACLDYLRSQVRIIRPEIIVCLGRISAQRLISPDFKVTKQHGEWFVKNGVYMMGVFHPAALLRNPNNKPLAFEDFTKIKDKLDELSE